MKKIETTEETKYTYTRFSFKQINGEQLLPEVQCWKNDSICKKTVVDGKVEIDIEAFKKEIPDYKFNSYKIYKFIEGEFEETDYIARGCEEYVIRLYYQRTKQESNETVVLGMISSLILVTVYFKMTKKEHE